MVQATATRQVPDGEVARVLERPTPFDALDCILETLDRRKGDWVRVPVGRRAALLRTCMQGVLDVADEWVDRALVAKGADPGSSTLAG